MAHKKQGGKIRQQKRTAGKRLGLKIADGQKVASGAVLVRQRGTRFQAGKGVRIGKDHTLYAVRSGIVKFGQKFGKKFVLIK